MAKQDGDIKKIKVYEHGGKVYNIKDNYLLVVLTPAEGGVEAYMASDLQGNDILVVLDQMVTLVANSVDKEATPLQRGTAYMAIQNVLKECARRVLEDHGEDIQAVAERMAGDWARNQIVLPPGVKQ